MKQSAIDDPAMSRVRALWNEQRDEGMTQEELGIAMGYPVESAKQSVYQFLRTRDPHISMLRRFSKAIGVPLSEIILG